MVKVQLKTIQHQPWIVKKTKEAWQQKSKTVFRLLQFILALLAACSVFLIGAISQQIGIIDNYIIPTLFQFHQPSVKEGFGAISILDFGKLSG